MVKKLVIRGTLAVVLLAVSFLGYNIFTSQRADYSWDAAVPNPAFVATHPKVVIDQAHNNASTADWTSRYYPLAKLLRNDGYDVSKGIELFTPASLGDIDVLIIANASGAPKPQMFGINLPVSVAGKREDPAFGSSEIEAVRDWVNSGGSLLLIADHLPFGAANAAMGQAFGVKMYQGYVEIPNEVSDPLLFSSENGRLGNHPILSGTGTESAVHRVMTFTGQSLDGPPEGIPLLILPDSAIEYVASGDTLAPTRAGTTQGLALEYGQGRVVVLGEAAMMTAQVYDNKPFGMNLPDNDNRQLALNILHWLSRKL
ncbi:MAG: hypothetical protein WAU88_08665 [Candidatus Zixiibacteriota bacterium]